MWPLERFWPACKLRAEVGWWSGVGRCRRAAQRASYGSGRKTHQEHPKRNPISLIARNGEGGISAGLLGIRSRLPRPTSKRLVQGCEELGDRQVKRPGQSIDNIHGRGLPPALEVADVGPVETRAVGQFFLREVEIPSQSPNAPAKGWP